MVSVKAGHYGFMMHKTIAIFQDLKRQGFKQKLSVNPVYFAHKKCDFEPKKRFWGSGGGGGLT